MDYPSILGQCFIIRIVDFEERLSSLTSRAMKGGHWEHWLESISPLHTKPQSPSCIITHCSCRQRSSRSLSIRVSMFQPSSHAGALPLLSSVPFSYCHFRRVETAQDARAKQSDHSIVSSPWGWAGGKVNRNQGSARNRISNAQGYTEYQTVLCGEYFVSKDENASPSDLHSHSITNQSEPNDTRGKNREPW